MDNITIDKITMDNITMDNLAMENLETHIEYRIAIKLWQIMPPLLILFGTFGNLLIIIVLLKKRNRNSATALYLVALAVSDLITLWAGLLHNWIIHVFDVDVRCISLSLYNVQHFMMNIGLQCSSWFLVAVTVERLLALCIPLKVKLLCSNTLAAVVIVSVVCILSTLNIHWFIGNGMVSLSNVTNISDIQCLPVTELYWNFRYNIWPWIDLCIVSLVPMAILFFCNLSIIYFLLKRTQALIQLEGNSFKIMRNTRNYSQVTGYLILLNAVFFICTAPISVYLIREESLLESAGESIHDLAVLQLWQAVVNLLSYTNNAANFLLYVLCGSRFRKEVKTVFCVRDTSTRNRSTFGRMTRVFVVNQS